MQIDLPNLTKHTQITSPTISNHLVVATVDATSAAEDRKLNTWRN